MSKAHNIGYLRSLTVSPIDDTIQPVLERLLQGIKNLASDDDQAFSFDTNSNTIIISSPAGLDQDPDKCSLQLLGYITPTVLLEPITPVEVPTFIARSEDRIITFSSAEAAYGILLY